MSQFPGLTSRHQETISALTHLDPQLAGIYNYGVRLLPIYPGPGLIFLLAHCGRELSNGIARKKLVDQHKPQVGQQCTLPLDSTRRMPGGIPRDLRARVACALNVEESNDLVSNWCQFHGSFVDKVHWTYPSPPAECATKLRRAFECFTTLICDVLSRTQNNVSQRNLDIRLRVMDPQLSGLYTQANALLRRVQEAGHVYLLAHCARELSRGVLRHLENPRQAAAHVRRELSQAMRPSSNLRSVIARLSGLSETHRSVFEWTNMHSEFNRAAHWRYPAPKRDDENHLRRHFEQFCDLVHSAVGLYFDTERELDVLLAEPFPKLEHAKRLARLQLRPPQREYFFSRVDKLSWFEPLRDVGMFKVPAMSTKSEIWGVYGMLWPEGTYLAKVASVAPNRVTAVLEAMPKTTTNPFISDGVVKIALQLPGECALKTVPMLTNALEKEPTENLYLFNRRIVDLIVSFANGKHENAAFTLASRLFFVANPEHIGTNRDRSSGWMFPRMKGLYLYEDLCKQIFGLLANMSFEKTIAFLLKKLRRIVRLEGGLRGRYDRSLWRYCNRLGAHRRPGDVVDALIGCVVALLFDVSGHEEESSRSEIVLRLLGEHRKDSCLFLRIWYLALSRLGHRRPDLLDDVLRSDDARHPKGAAWELSELFCRQFASASDEAKSEFAEFVKTELGVHEQVRMLKRFRDEIPAVLLCLVNDLETAGYAPPEREQEIAEIGYPVSVGAGRAPVSVDQLRSWTFNQVVAYLGSIDWNDHRDSHVEFRKTLRKYAKACETEAISILTHATLEKWDVNVVGGIVDGIEDAVKSKSMDWTVAISCANDILQKLSDFEDQEIDDKNEWRKVVGGIAKWVQEGCHNGTIPATELSNTWTLLGTADRTLSRWQEIHLPEVSIGWLWQGQVNDACGIVAQAILSMARMDYLLRQERFGSLNQHNPKGAIGALLIPILDRWVGEDGRDAAILRAIIGANLPLLFALVPKWVREQSMDLLVDGIEKPILKPTWTMYICQAPLNDVLFSELRQWYSDAVGNATSWASAINDEDYTFAPTGHLALHLIVAFLRGLISIGDEDRLLDSADVNLSGKDWEFAYERVFRELSEVKMEGNEKIGLRLVEFWEWRIRRLEAVEKSDRIMREVRALWWLFELSCISNFDRVRLGCATVRLADGRVAEYVNWEQMCELVDFDVDGVFEMTDTIVRKLTYRPEADLKRLLSRILDVGNGAMRIQTRRLIHWLGEHGTRGLRRLVVHPDDVAKA